MMNFRIWAGPARAPALLLALAVAGVSLVHCTESAGGRQAAPPTAPAPPRSSPGVSPETTPPDPQSLSAPQRVPEVALQGVSQSFRAATPQPGLSTWQVFDEALDDLLDDLPVAIEEAMNAGQSEASVSTSLVPGVMGIVGRLVTLTDDAYASENSGAVGSSGSSTSSVPCTECSDNLTRCLDDALDNFVDCVFECGTFDGGCRRNCKRTWRAEKSECFDAHRECVRTCTPK